MDKKAIDYTLYLVTDSTPALLGDRDICDVVEAALNGGVTIVQYRDKSSDTRSMITTARRLHSLTQQWDVPLLINDRVDVALAVGCEGVHLGQDDMDLPTARRLLGPEKIIGATVSSVEEANQAQKDGADYLGIGTVYATSTKKDTKQILGVDGLRDVLTGMDPWDKPCVCIGGINLSNATQALSIELASKGLNGVAVVSAIVAAKDPELEARKLAKALYGVSGEQQPTRQRLAVVSAVPHIIKAVHDRRPLSHNMTNLVVQNFAANIALAVGASPIMANYGEEAADLAKLGGALVINMGTVTPEGIDNYIKALRAYNNAGGPVVFDPVGAGATAIRRQAVKTIMAAGQMAVIKGNESEIKTVWGQASGEVEAQRGVDSSSTLDEAQKAELVQQVAQRHKCVVVLTGVADYVSDGTDTYVIKNGHPILGTVTGTGCVLGTTISAMVAAWPKDHLAAVIAGMLLYEIAAERAMLATSDGQPAKIVRGPGSFVPAFIDELHNLRTETAEGGGSTWLQRRNVTKWQAGTIIE